MRIDNERFHIYQGARCVTAVATGGNILPTVCACDVVSTKESYVPRRESEFQAKLIRELRERLPGCIILKNDPNYLQGIPDLTVLWRDHWALLECKASESAPVRPNQEPYVELLDAMSFSAFIFPENREQVLDDLQHAFEATRPARVSERQQVSLDQLRSRSPSRGLA